MHSKSFLKISVFTFVVCAMFSLSQARAATLTVDDDHAQCPSASFTSIQAAVTAANPGDKINVCPGTYPEQVTINKALTISGVEIAGENLATIRPIGVIANSASLTSGNPVAAIVLVVGANNVTLTNLTVDGAANGINACAPNLIGIYYRNASGKVDGVAVKNIKLTPALFGCQSGLGIFVQSGGGLSKVEVTNSSVHDYQKNGITGNEVGTEINIKGNTVTGIGPTTQIAQNGIQLGFGAKGVVESNSVINHVYSPCTSSSCDAASANILIFGAEGVKVAKNNAGNAQLNVYYEGNKGEVASNVIFQTLVFDGINLIGNGNKASSNTIMNSEESAIFVAGDRNEVTGNTINETPVGVLVDTASTNTKITGNQYYNTGMNTAPFPSSLSAAALVVGGGESGPAVMVKPAQP